MPYLDQQELFKQYHFDEPWDGPHNRKLLGKMPAWFRDPGEQDQSQNASYFVLSGPGTIFDGKEGTAFRLIRDGSSNTILAVEARRDIPWTKPEDIPYDPNRPLPKLGGYHAGGFFAALADGAVRFVPEGINEKSLRDLITKADGHAVDINAVTLPYPPRAQGRALGRPGTGGTYKASAMLQVAMAARPDVSSAEALRAALDRFEIYKSTQQQLLTEPLCAAGCLAESQFGQARLGSPGRQTRRCGGLAAATSCKSPSRAKPRLMEVSFSSNDPNEAATVVNIVVDTYLNEVASSEREHNRARLQEIDRDLRKRRPKFAPSGRN